MNFDKKGLFGLGSGQGSSTEVDTGRDSNLRRERLIGWGVDAYNIINEEKQMPAFESPIIFRPLFPP